MNKICQPIVFVALIMAFVSTVGVYMFEGKGVSGDFFQLNAGVLLIVVGLLELLSVKNAVARVRGISTLACCAILLYPTIVKIIS